MRKSSFWLSLGLALCAHPSWAAFPSGTPAAVNGRLSVCGTTLCSEAGRPVQLRGVSSHGLSWYGQFMNASSISWMAKDWGIDVVRGAMYTAEYNGYAVTPSYQATLEAKIDEMVNAAEAAGVYMIIDWHILSDANPLTHKAAAKTFFQKMATKYKGKTHVLYEICNEPNGATTWADIKTYANEIIPAIRAIDPLGVVIVGTPTWSQDVDIAAASPLPASLGNVMYALHFYSATHKQSLRTKISTAVSKGLPIFATEWGSTDASGTGVVDTAETTTWLNFLAANKISWCNWSISDKAETSAALAAGASTTGNWTAANLTLSGKYVRNRILNPADDFAPLTGPFTLTIPSLTGGSIVATPAKAQYTKGEVVSLQAVPATGYVFQGWNGAASGTTNPLSVTMNANTSIGADFLSTTGGPNLVINGTYDAGTANWGLGWNGNGAAGSGAIVNGEYKTTITSGGLNSWDVQLTQSGIALQAGRVYELAFDAYSTGARTINPNVGQNGGTYASYSAWAPVAITATKTRYTLRFTMNASGDAAARLEFNLGQSTLPVMLDNVVLREPGTAPVNQAPTIGLTSSATSATAPATVTLTATPADVDGSIAKVEWLRNGTVVSTKTAAPWTYAASALAAGSYSFTARATDNAGAATTSSAVVVTVTAVVTNKAPTIGLTSSATTATAPATVTLTATPADADGSIAKVEWLRNGTVVSTKTAAPWTYAASALAAGSYSFTARATDNAGAATTSSAVVVTVTAVVTNKAPTIGLTSSATTATAPATVTLTATPADADGSIAKVEWLKNGVVAFTKTAAPWTYAPSALVAGTYSFTARATDNAGAATTSSAVNVTVIAAGSGYSFAATPNPMPLTGNLTYMLTVKPAQPITFQIYNAQNVMVRTFTEQNSKVGANTTYIQNSNQLTAGTYRAVMIIGGVAVANCTFTHL